MQRAGLDATAMGRDWISAAAAAVAAPIDVTLPFKETAYLPAQRANAVAYRVQLARGRRFTVDVSFQATDGGRLFVDLFRIVPDAQPDRVASLADDETSLTYDVERDGEYVLRVQPELLRSGRFTITQRTLASLPFPISGATARAVRSGFGVARDAGAREHEGIDIFMPRGTPVVAVVDGTAEQSTNALGGNVVWLSRGFTGPRYYYAHLDRWAITGTSRVRAGDVLGYVGNTGNARTTSPHLHFGIYDRGAIDPLPFVGADDPSPAESSVPLERLDVWVRVTASRARVRSGPHAEATTRQEVERGRIARVAAVSGTSVRLMLPDDSGGYVAASQVAPALSTSDRSTLPAEANIWESPTDDAPLIVRLSSPRSVRTLGRHASFDLVMLEDGTEGWVRRER